MALRTIGISIIVILILMLAGKCYRGENGIVNLVLPATKPIIESEDILSMMTRDIMYQDSLLLAIQAELERIDNLSLSYRNAVEEGEVSNIQAETIIKRIEALKKRIMESEKAIGSLTIENEGLLRLVEKFTRELEEKENEIRLLNESLREHQIMIQEREKQVEELEILSAFQKDEISKLNHDLRLTKSHAYRELADLLMQIRQEVPEVKGIFTKKSKDDLEAMSRKLLDDASRYYQEAARNGDAYSKSKLESIGSNLKE